LHADVRQNRPIARLVHADTRRDSYLDAEGHELPLSPLFTARVVPVARQGGLELPASFFRDSTGRRYLEVLRYIDEHPFWRAQVAEVFIGPNGKLAFTQQIGDQRVEFGFPENISEKFAKLMVFYRQIPPVLGWNTYHRVNVEFKDQIICE
jgi:cell division protein FtsQ